MPSTYSELAPNPRILERNWGVALPIFVRFLLVIFLFFVIAFPAAAGNAFDKAWSEAHPGWYLKISYNSGIGWYPDTRATNWWHQNALPPIRLPPEDVLALIEADIDERNKPIFIKKLSASFTNPPPSGCLHDVFIFRVDGREVEVRDPTSHYYSFQKCRTSNKWELLRKSCGNENIGACISDKFSKKFPFDILFNLPSTEITCPKINFFGSEFDLCFIYEALRLMKYPIAAALFIKLFLSL